MATDTKTETRAVTFISDRPNPTFVIEGEDQDYNSRGRIVAKYERSALEFDDHRCTLSEYDGPMEKYEGRACVNGVVQGLPYDEMLAAVEDHPKFGSWFHLEGKGPQDKEPSVEEVRAFLADDPSEEEMRRLLAEERETHNRPEIIGLITDAALGVTPGK